MQVEKEEGRRARKHIHPFSEHFSFLWRHRACIAEKNKRNNVRRGDAEPESGGDELSGRWRKAKVPESVGVRRAREVLLGGEMGEDREEGKMKG